MDELERRGLWGIGETPFAHWLAWRYSLQPSRAREYETIAGRLRELPRIREAFGRGKLSYAKVKALAPIADEASEEELVELAFGLSSSQLERATRWYRKVTREETRKAEERSTLSYSWNEDGSLSLRARLPADDGVLLLRALERARETVAERRKHKRAQANEARADQQARPEQAAHAEETEPPSWQPPDEHL